VHDISSIQCTKVEADCGRSFEEAREKYAFIREKRESVRERESERERNTKKKRAIPCYPKKRVP